jgi:hypothetical protein
MFAGEVMRMSLLNLFFFMILALIGFTSYRLLTCFENRRASYYRELRYRLNSCRKMPFDMDGMNGDGGSTIELDFFAGQNRDAGKAG